MRAGVGRRRLARTSPTRASGPRCSTRWRRARARPRARRRRSRARRRARRAPPARRGRRHGGAGAAFTGERAARPPRPPRPATAASRAANLLADARTCSTRWSTASPPRPAATWPRGCVAALAAGLAAGGEAGPVRSAGLLVGADVPWPVVDLRVDWHDDPVAELRALWELWAPQLDDYVTRALDPEQPPPSASRRRAGLTRWQLRRALHAAPARVLRGAPARPAASPRPRSASRSPQSSVSAAIAQLEARRRRAAADPPPRPGRLPDARRAALPRARPRAARRGRRTSSAFATELTQELSGPLALGCLVTLAPLVTPRLCHEFARPPPGRRRSRSSRPARTTLLDGLRTGGAERRRDLRPRARRRHRLRAARRRCRRTPSSPPTTRSPAARSCRSSRAGRASRSCCSTSRHSRDYFRSLFAEPRARAERRAPLRRTPRSSARWSANGYGYTIVNARPRIDHALDGRRVRTVPLAGGPRPMVLGRRDASPAGAADAGGDARSASTAGAMITPRPPSPG